MSTTKRPGLVVPVGAGDWAVHTADSLTLLAELPDASIDAVISDPPYGIDFANQAWDGRTIRHVARQHTGRRLSREHAFQEWTRLWASQLARVVKPGGHIACFGATRMAHRLACGLEDGGLELRDTLIWMFGTGMPKSRRLPGGQGTALKPAYEPIILTRRPPNATIQATMAKWGTGALNTQACAINEPRACEARTHKRAAAAGGRWPANVLLDHHPDCSNQACQPGCPVGRLEAQHPGASRFLYCAKASRRERDAGCEKRPDRHLDLFPQTSNLARPQRSVKNDHPTVKPIALMGWLVALLTPPDGVVLDPFCGSGSTGCAAVQQQRAFLGIERDPDHAELARTRITHWQQHPRPSQPRRRPTRAGQRRPA